MTFDEILAAAMALNVDERLQLIESIEESLERDGGPRFSPEYLAELDRRCADFDAGKTKETPWEEVKAAALARLRQSQT